MAAKWENFADESWVKHVVPSLGEKGHMERKLIAYVDIFMYMFSMDVWAINLFQLD